MYESIHGAACCCKYRHRFVEESVPSQSRTLFIARFFPKNAIYEAVGEHSDTETVSVHFTMASGPMCGRVEGGGGRISSVEFLIAKEPVGKDGWGVSDVVSLGAFLSRRTWCMSVWGEGIWLRVH